MATAMVKRAEIGTLDWLEQSGGRLTFGERLSLVAGMFGTLREGMRLGRHAKRSNRRDTALAALEPPDTPMVNAARAFVRAHCGGPMANHSYRTGYWTQLVMQQHGVVTQADFETAWVAALLHDVGLELPPARGDFSVRGVEIVKELALEIGWSDEQVHFASEAIATNLSLHVDPSSSGIVAWAMNVGGTGEVGFRPHRAQMHPDRIAELEALYPRTDFRPAAMALIQAEARRVPGGRFSWFRWVFPLMMKG